MRSQPALDLSSSLINVAHAASTPASQNSGNMVTQTPLLSTAGTILPIQQINLLERPTVHGPLSVSLAATRLEAQSSGNTEIESQVSASPVANQNASAAAIHDSVGTNSQPQPTQQINSSIDMVLQGQSPTSATVSQTASTLPVDNSFNIRSQRQIATLATNFQPSQEFNSSIGKVPLRQSQALAASNSYTVPTLPVDGSFNTLPQEPVPLLATNSLTLPRNSVNMVPQRQFATAAIGSQMAIRPVQPFVSGNATPESQILRLTGISDESFGQSSLNVFSQPVAQLGYTASFNTGQELEWPETGYQVANEAILGLHGSSSMSSTMFPHPSTRIAQSPGLTLLAKVGEAQREQYGHSIGNRETIHEVVVVIM